MEDMDITLLLFLPGAEDEDGTLIKVVAAPPARLGLGEKCGGDTWGMSLLADISPPKWDGAPRSAGLRTGREEGENVAVVWKKGASWADT